MPRSRAFRLVFALFICVMLLIIMRNVQRHRQGQEFGRLIVRGDVAGVKRMLIAGADPNIRDANLGSMFRGTLYVISGSTNSRSTDKGIIAKEVEIAHLLLAAGAEPKDNGVNIGEDILDTALTMYPDNAAHEIVPDMLAHGARLKTEHLGSVVRYGDPALVKTLLDRGADPNRLYGIESPLRKACQNFYMNREVSSNKAYLEVVQLLLERGANPNAVSYREVSIVPIDTLPNQQISYRHTSKDYRDVVSTAASSGAVELMNLLLAHGADVNIKGQYNQTALMSAVAVRKPDMVRLLLSRGADVRAANRDGKTALGIATNIAAGKFVMDPYTHKMRTPAQLAADKQVGSQMVALLRQAGATK